MTTGLLVLAVLVLGVAVIVLSVVARYQYRHAIVECRGMRGEVIDLREEVNRLRARLPQPDPPSKG